MPRFSKVLFLCSLTLKITVLQPVFGGLCDDLSEGQESSFNEYLPGTPEYQAFLLDGESYILRTSLSDKEIEAWKNHFLKILEGSPQRAEIAEVFATDRDRAEGMIFAYILDEKEKYQEIKSAISQRLESSALYSVPIDLDSDDPFSGLTDFSKKLSEPLKEWRKTKEVLGIGLKDVEAEIDQEESENLWSDFVAECARLRITGFRNLKNDAPQSTVKFTVTRKQLETLSKMIVVKRIQ